MSQKQKLVQYFLSCPSDVPFEKVKTLVELLGFEEVRANGSHHIFRHSDGRSITIPKKGGQTVKRTYIKLINVKLNLEDYYKKNFANQENCDDENVLGLDEDYYEES